MPLFQYTGIFFVHSLIFIFCECPLCSYFFPLFHHLCQPVQTFITDTVYTLPKMFAPIRRITAFSVQTILPAIDNAPNVLNAVCHA